MAWTQEEELRLLTAALEIAEEPVASFNPSVPLFGRIRRMLATPFTDDEILAKIKELRRSYEDNCFRTGRGVCDVAAFAISSRIWGRVNGCTAAAAGAKRKGSGSLLMYYRRRKKLRPNNETVDVERRACKIQS